MREVAEEMACRPRQESLGRQATDLAPLGHTQRLSELLPVRLQLLILRVCCYKEKCF